MSFRLNYASCSSKLYLCLHLANCSNLFLANFHLTFSFPVLGCAIQSHCSWCVGRFEELPFSYGSFQLAIFWWGELGIHCLLLFLLHVFFFFSLILCVVRGHLEPMGWPPTCCGPEFGGGCSCHFWDHPALQGYWLKGNLLGRENTLLVGGWVLWNFKVLASVRTVPKYSLTRTRSNPQGLEWM